jgi:hypothetical protein
VWVWSQLVDCVPDEQLGGACSPSGEVRLGLGGHSCWLVNFFIGSILFIAVHLPAVLLCGPLVQYSVECVGTDWIVGPDDVGSSLPPLDQHTLVLV